ncbi:hypothetical protein L2E82_12443 [Cichorium intybus]|uniref:Uncharacterized protein n=1 Tax=Cichorium intybus TaxID=13427 RepID=A0ACB9GGU3_CICIN|nr:hypothetical protein L2E82_12443 [Cichorium intybus]
MLRHLGTRLDLPRALSLFPAIVDVGRDVAEELLSAQTKRATMEKKAAAASVAAEDFPHRFESGDMAEVSIQKIESDSYGYMPNTVFLRHLNTELTASFLPVSYWSTDIVCGIYKGS